MYLWKLWREGWMVLAVCLFLALLSVGVRVRQSQYFVQRAVSVSADQMWFYVTPVGLLAVVFATLLAALVMPEIAVGNEVATGTAEFLLTRARPRRYYVWAGWSFGMLQLLHLPLLIVGCEVGALVCITGTFVSWRPFAVCALVVPMVAIVYGTGYLLCVVMRNGRHAVAATFVGIVLYVIATRALPERWGFVWPDWWFHNLPGWAWQQRATPFPVVALLGWSVLALLFPALAQWRLERTEL